MDFIQTPQKDRRMNTENTITDITKRFLCKKSLRKKLTKILYESLKVYPVNNPFDNVAFEDPRVFEFISPEEYIEIIEGLQEDYPQTS
jgi:hypothetical protein